MTQFQNATAVMLLVSLQTVGFSQSPAHWRAVADRIDAVTPELMERYKTPGVSIALIDSKQIVWCGCYGFKRAGSSDPVNEETVFEACSMSKPLFGYAVLKLVEQQRLELERPLVAYLDEPYLKDQPLHEKITAKMVLTHTTGFPNWRKGGWRAKGPLPVEFEPGTRYGYSGEGIWYLQQVVERIVGEAMEPWIQRTLLQLVGMKQSSYKWQVKYESQAAAGHNAKGNCKDNRSLFDRDNAAFSLYTTPSDYARFLIEIMTADGTKPHSLTGKSIDAMLTPLVKSDRPDAWRGLGWVITRRNGKSFVSHSGSNGTGFRCHSRFDPSRGSGIVIMTNAVGGANVWKGIMAALDVVK